MTKGFLFYINILFVFCYCCTIKAQREEPVSNIGKSFTEMNTSVFTGMKYRRQINGKIEYEWGNPNDGMIHIFTFSDNKLITECMLVESNDGFATQLYNSLCDTFIGKYRWALTSSSTGKQHFIFTKYTLDIILNLDGGTEVLMFIYNKL